MTEPASMAEQRRGEGWEQLDLVHWVATPFKFGRLLLHHASREGSQPFAPQLWLLLPHRQRCNLICCAGRLATVRFSSHCQWEADWHGAEPLPCMSDKEMLGQRLALRHGAWAPDHSHRLYSVPIDTDSDSIPHHSPLFSSSPLVEVCPVLLTAGGHWPEPDWLIVCELRANERQ